MRKILATILSVCTLTAASILPTAGLFSPKSAPKAGAEPVAKTCTAATKDLTAVSHGKQLYLFNRTEGGVWQTYEHTEPISHMEFDAHGNLYFLNEDAIPTRTLYKLNAKDFQKHSKPVNTDIQCQTFFLQSEYLYSVHLTNSSEPNTNFVQIPLDTLVPPAEQTPVYTIEKAIPFSIVGYEGGIYMLNTTLDGETTLYRSTLQDSKPEKFLTSSEPLSSIVVTANTLYGLTDNGAIYTCDIATKTEQILTSESGYTALSTDGDKAYIIKGNCLYSYQAGESSPQLSIQNDYPTTDTIPVGSVKTELSKTQTATLSTVQTQENSLLMEVDLEGSETYFKTTDTKRGVLKGLQLAATDKYTLFASYEADYKTYIIANSCIDTLSTGYTQGELSGYANGSGKLYKYPVMSDNFPTLSQTERNAPLEIMGTITGLDGEYYAVKSGAYIGYLPKTHARLFDGSTPPAEQIELGNKGSDKDAVWRLAYILLGTVAIAILADFLILRKKPKDK